MTFNIASEDSVIFYLEDLPSEKSIQRLDELNSAFKKALGPLCINSIPSYQSILLTFDVLRTTHDDVILKLKSALNEVTSGPRQVMNNQLIRLPVFYDDETGPDLQRIAEHHNTKIEDIVTKHCMAVYQVYAIGFAPGFAYLGDVDERIEMPRLTTPRTSVPKGSVGIADRQTAIYPAESPGGWNIIGRCPSTLFDPNKTPHMPFKVGDRVQFMPITRDEFLYLGGEL